MNFVFTLSLKLCATYTDVYCDVLTLLYFGWTCPVTLDFFFTLQTQQRSFSLDWTSRRAGRSSTFIMSDVSTILLKSRQYMGSVSSIRVFFIIYYLFNTITVTKQVRIWTTFYCYALANRHHVSILALVSVANLISCFIFLFCSCLLFIEWHHCFVWL